MSKNDKINLCTSASVNDARKAPAMAALSEPPTKRKTQYVDKAV